MVEETETPKTPPLNPQHAALQKALEDIDFMPPVERVGRHNPIEGALDKDHGDNGYEAQFFQRRPDTQRKKLPVALP